MLFELLLNIITIIAYIIVGYITVRAVSFLFQYGAAVIEAPSTVFHEYGHATAARRLGYTINEQDYFSVPNPFRLFFGREVLGYVDIGGQPDSLRDTIFFYAAPLLNFPIAIGLATGFSVINVLFFDSLSLILGTVFSFILWYIISLFTIAAIPSGHDMRLIWERLTAEAQNNSALYLFYPPIGLLYGYACLNDYSILSLFFGIVTAGILYYGMILGMYFGL